MLKIETEESIHTSLETLPIFAAARYQSWIKTLILSQKQNPSRPVMHWLAKLLVGKMPAHWKTVPLAWLPGKPFGELHLVEALALELYTLGQPLVSRPLYQRRLRPVAAQKNLSLTMRKSRDIGDVFRVLKPSRVKKVILLDDVITTGSTVLGCQKILQEKTPDMQICGALSLAFTVRQSPR